MAVNVLVSLVFGFLAGFLFAFGIGANEVANSFATSIGSGAITLIKAFVLASICEVVGALLLGDGVASEMSQEVINIHLFDDQLDKLILGYLSALVSSTLWLVLAATLKMPVSATQTAIGAMIGMSIAAFGFTSINLQAVLKILLSWTVSPIMAGVVSVSIYVILRLKIFHLPSVKLQLGRSLFVLPFLYFLTVAVNIFICLLEKPTFMPTNMQWSVWIPATIGISVGVIFAILVAFIYIPYLRKSVKEQSFFEKRSPSQETTENDLAELMTAQSHCEHFMEAEEFDDIGPLFWVLQILASCFSSVAHGGNNVANAIVPTMAMMQIYSTGNVPNENLSTPTWLLVLGASGMTVGLWAMGRRIIDTVGSDLTHLTPPKSFCIEIGASLTILIASQLHLPISTTFCRVGSIIFVSLSSGKSKIDWKIVSTVVFTWAITVPISGLISGGIMSALIAVFIPSDRSIIDTYIANISTTINSTALVY